MVITMKVTIICSTFNHEKYISRCLHSLVYQKTNFEYQIIVHDDASTDRTSDIIMSFANRFPSIIIPIIEKENLHSKGLSSMPIINRYIKGDYVAYCEGDDYWLNKNKLQMQVDYLDSNPNINLCFHSAITYNNKTCKYERRIGYYGDKPMIISNNKLIVKGGSSMATNSIVLRMSSYNKKNVFVEKYKRNKPVGDFIIQTIGSENGALYLPQIMSAYRINVNGSWTNRQEKAAWDKEIEFKHQMSLLYNALDAFLKNKFSKAFKKRKVLDCKDILLNSKIPAYAKMNYFLNSNLYDVRLFLLIPLAISNPFIRVIKKTRAALMKL